MIRRSVKNLLLRTVPRWIAARNLRRTRDPIKKLLPELCDERRTSLDVGASRGSYTDCIFPYSRNCVAFEPRPEAYEQLRQRYAAVAGRVSVEGVALGDESGSACLRVPIHDPGRSTIAQANPLEEMEEQQIRKIHVPLKCIDEFHFEDVGFIKIDAEGNELAILRGASGVLEQSHPNLVIEIEQRHHPDGVARVTDFLAAFNYRGSFYYKGTVLDIQQFQEDVHQPFTQGSKVDANVYAHNFVFKAA